MRAEPAVRRHARAPGSIGRTGAVVTEHGDHLRADLRALLDPQTLRRLGAKLRDDDVPGMAAEVSFYALFALFPFLMLVAAVIGLVIDDPALALTRFFLVMHRFMPAATAGVLTHFLEGPLRSDRPGLASVGILTTLWAGSQGIAAMLKALHRVYCANDRARWLRHRMMSLAWLLPALVVSVVLLIVMTGDAPDGILAAWIHMSWLGTAIWVALRWPVMFAVTAWVLGSTYATVSCARPRPRWISTGALIAAGTWIVSSVALAAYWDRAAAYAVNDAPVGDVLALMVWLYAGVAIVLLGAEIDAVLGTLPNASRTAAR